LKLERKKKATKFHECGPREDPQQKIKAEIDRELIEVRE